MTGHAARADWNTIPVQDNFYSTRARVPAGLLCMDSHGMSLYNKELE